MLIRNRANSIKIAIKTMAEVVIKGLHVPAESESRGIGIFYHVPVELVTVKS